MFRCSTLIVVAAFTIGAQAQCVTTYPSAEPFTSFTVGTPGTLANNWTNLAGDDLDWWADDNGTPTASTGPIGDHTTYNTAGKYMFVSAAAAGTTPNKSAMLQSPCYSLTALTNPFLTFWYHMKGTQMGTLYLDLNVNGVVTQNLWSASGDQGDFWKQGYLNLSAYSTQTNLRLRFRVVTGSGVLSDIAIDDVTVQSLVPVYGCTEATASNYSAGANVNNGTCSYACGTGYKRVRIDVVADNYPGEMSWNLTNANTNAVLASGTTMGTSLCVPTGTCMTFNMLDAYGDGICCGYGNGAYSLYYDGALVSTNGAYGAGDHISFNCSPGYACSTALTAVAGTVYTTPTIEAWYNFTPTATGSYTITTCGLNTCDTKLWMYDNATCGAITLSSGLEGATYASDDLGGCGLQAVITANLPANQLYHLRAGTNNGSCTTARFQIIYNGPAVGCMNTVSCNYDPLATVACTNCCLAQGDPNCPPGPDLQMDQPTLQGSLSLSTVNITDACAPAEGCVKAMGTRYVLKFSTRINNIGQTDYYIGSPSANPGMFSTANCHGHAHYQGYADYVLFDQTGHAIPVGFKNGFCVIDVGCPNGTAHYGCSNMGISKGCYDQYGTGTTCNWIDITDVAAGTYTLVLRTNWSHRPDALNRYETNYLNNYAQVCVNITRDGNNVPSFSIVTSCPIWTDCLGVPYGDARLDCYGTCAGTTKSGDLSNNSTQDMPDAQVYVQGILGNDVGTTVCTDLNNDARISVTDAALMVNCYTQRDAYEATGPFIHYHPWCEFPRGYVSSTDTARLTISAFDPVAKTVDIAIKNSTCRVMGYEFSMSGLTIQTVDNLVPSFTGDITMSTTLGGTKVIGLSYVDTSMAKNSSFTPLCRIHYVNITGAQICINSISDIVNKDANNIVTGIVAGCVSVPNTITLNLKAWLEGPYDSNALLMRDDLRSPLVIPVTEPYTAAGFAQAGGGGGEAVAASVFNTTGNNAIVDWVLVELRNANTPSQIVSTRSALIQRDGDVVALNGVSPVVVNAASGNYYVALRHRNHLGVMTAAPVSLSGAAATVDFRTAAMATYGTVARKDINGAQALWAGNVFLDGAVKYTGTNNDRDPILTVIGGTVPTNSVAGYYREDVNLSGVVKYTGTSNDRDPILLNIGGTVPNSTKLEQLP